MTTRRADSLNIVPWAQNGLRIDPEDASLTPPLDRDLGWTSEWEVADGNPVRLRPLQQLLFEVTNMLDEINRKGALLPWHNLVMYQHPCYVTGSDGNIYGSVRNNVGNDPTLDTGTNWIALAVSVATATRTVRGTVLLANQSDYDNALANNMRVVTAGLTVPVVHGGTGATGASAGRQNLGIRFATQSEYDTAASTSTRLVTAGLEILASKLKGLIAADRIPDLDASKTTTGVFPLDRIPDLDASKTTTGVFPLDRIPIVIHTTQASYDNASSTDNTIHMLAE